MVKVDISRRRLRSTLLAASRPPAVSLKPTFAENRLPWLANQAPGTTVQIATGASFPSCMVLAVCATWHRITDWHILPIQS